MHPLRRRPGGDTGGVVLGWLTRVAVVLALVGVVCFDAVSIAVSRLAVEDAGTLAAREASTELARTGSVQVAYATARSAATDAHPLSDVPPATFEVLADGAVRLVVTREAATLLVSRIGWTERLGHVEAQATGRPLP